MSSAVVTLPHRPRFYGHGPDLPLGQYHIAQHVTAGGWTVVRTIGMRRYAPLTARENPAWRTWPSFHACMSECMDGFEFDCADWPHWGA